MESIEKNISKNQKLGEEKNCAFKYPTCWQDDERMAVLFAPFRERSVNPENYDSKLKFWQDMIRLYCEHKGETVLNVRKLKLEFIRNQRVPECLHEVLEMLLQTRHVCKLNAYDYDPLCSWSEWVINNALQRPTKWFFYKLKSAFWHDNADELQYVHLDMLNKFCELLRTEIFSYRRGTLLHYNELTSLISTLQTRLTDKCLQLCLHTLHCQREIGLSYFTNDKHQIKIIKIPALGNEKKNQNICISEGEEATLNLQLHKNKLLEQLSLTEAEIKLNEASARKHIQNHERLLAKTYLRRNKLLKNNHEKRSLILHNIETLLISIEEAKYNGEILNAYKIGSNALKYALNSNGLKYENVDEILTDMSESLEAHREIQDTLTNTDLNVSDVSFDEELERELNEIVSLEEVSQNEKICKTIEQMMANILIHC